MSSRSAPARLDARAAPGSKTEHLFLTLFLIALVIPVSISLAGLRLTPARILLLLLAIPLSLNLLSGKYGKLILTDLLMGLFTLWSVLSLMVSMGPSYLEFAGITAIEIWASYLIGRCLVRSSDSFRFVTRVLIPVVLFILIEAMAQSIGRFSLYDPFFSALGDTFPWPREERLGLLRASSTFEHPILYGVFCAATFSLLVYAPRVSKPGILGWRIAWLPMIATFFSLSVGGWLPLIGQIMLIAWDVLFRNFVKRWKLLLTLVITVFVALDLASNRTPFEVFISYFTLDSNTAYWRILIFQHASDDVMQNPIFGIGLHDWSRPHFMYSSSVDNFWLLTAMRHGLPGLALIASAYLAGILRCNRNKDVPPHVQKQQLGLSLVLVCLGVSIATVHLWGATFLYFCFLIGTTNAFSNATQQPPQDQNDPQADHTAGRAVYTRTPITPGRRRRPSTPPAAHTRAGGAGRSR